MTKQLQGHRIRYNNAQHRRNPGTALFWYQRITAVALIFLGGWFVYALLTQVPAAYFNVLAWVQMPINTGALFILITVMIFHGQMGLQVIVEDYIHHNTLRNAIVNFIKTASIALILFTIYLLVMIHYISIPSPTLLQNETDRSEVLT